MKKFVCPVCGYVHVGEFPPEKCPQCGSMLYKKKNKNLLICKKEECGYKADIPEQPQNESEEENS